MFRTKHMTFRGLVTAACVATGKLAPEGERIPSAHRCEELPVQILLDLASSLDRHEDALHDGLARMAEDAAYAQEKLRRFGACDSPVSAQRAQETAAEATTVRALREVFGPAFSVVFGINFTDALDALKHCEACEEPSYTPAWLLRASGLLKLAKAWRAEDDARLAAEKAAAVQREKDEREAAAKARAAKAAETRRQRRIA